MDTSGTELPVLSICLTCRDGREDRYDGERGGTRLARALLTGHLTGENGCGAFRVRGVKCISQCKRSCAIALSGPNRFTYVFGDLDPQEPSHLDAVITVSSLYLDATEGFLRREDRPAPLQTGILGRVPPLNTGSDLVTPLWPEIATQ